MPNEHEVIATKKPSRFELGHARYGGKKKGNTQAARELAEAAGCSPLEFLIALIMSDTLEQSVIVGGKKTGKQTVLIPLDVRIDAAKTLAQYLHPKLNATALSGLDGGPIATVGCDLNELMRDPKFAAMAQDLALQMAARPDSPRLALPPANPDAQDPALQERISDLARHDNQGRTK
jgi:hypothetical protein